MAPRRNPDIVVAVLWEHGGWGAGSATLAAQVINTFVTKQRRLQNNLRIAEVAKPAPLTPAADEAPAGDAKPAAAQKSAATEKPVADVKRQPAAVAPAAKSAPAAE